MLERKEQPVEEGDTPPTEDEICDDVLGPVIGYVPGFGHAFKPNSSTQVRKGTFRQLEETSKRAEQAEKRADAAEKRAAELSEEVQSLTQKTDRLESFVESLALRMDNGGFVYTIAKGLHIAKDRVCSSQTKQKSLVRDFFMANACEVLEVLEVDHLFLLGLFGLCSAAGEVFARARSTSERFAVSVLLSREMAWTLNFN
ncbi:hypothetical protein RHGRI_019437 [Rhododendron griersonianum]|uniref:Uncharacterized protein n=1 Tax=Rhododendron griersonianum TaxID=479676 RepID=A0AAV6JCH5_9ERIC|nr:hypothetical protein RHGRI_019437 [Rhododendron griersonianum]